MIKNIHIKNFKSIFDLNIDVGRINLFIGENGSGKSNLLEALVFVSASEADKLDNEFLSTRGIRVTEPSLMRSAFSKTNKTKDISITIVNTDETTGYTFYNDESEYSKWKTLHKIFNEHDEIVQLLNKSGELKEKNDIEKFAKSLSKSEIKSLLSYFKNRKRNLDNFIIYSPENTALQKFESENQIQPLGINGEGLLKLLKVVNSYEDKSYINTIIKSLQLFNWFEDIKIPSNLSYVEDELIIKDKYLYKEINQKSANEGFLFILFYITLLVAKETPKAFAIDNIDASLNPKLCTKLMTTLTELAHKYDKQIFLTTHNPAMLDGIDLNDDEQKLFVLSRNKQGYTRQKEITKKDNPISDDGESLHLSEAFLRGYLGGLPKGF
jgi:AAA15 family ATPase/GTPase